MVEASEEWQEVADFSHLDDKMGVGRKVLHHLLGLQRDLWVNILEQGDQERDAVTGVSNLLRELFFL